MSVTSQLTPDPSWLAASARTGSVDWVWVAVAAAVMLGLVVFGLISKRNSRK